MGNKFKLGETVRIRHPAPFVGIPGACIDIEFDEFGFRVYREETFEDVTLNTQALVDEYNAREFGL